MSAAMLLHLRVCAANIPSLAAWDNWGSQLGSNTWPASSGLPQYVQSEVSLKWSCLPPIQLSSWQTTLMAGAWPLAVTLANVQLEPHLPRPTGVAVPSAVKGWGALLSWGPKLQHQFPAQGCRSPTSWAYRRMETQRRKHPAQGAPTAACASAISCCHHWWTQRAPTTSIWRISPVYLWFLPGQSKKTPGQHKTDRHNQHEAQERIRQSKFSGTLKQQQDTWLLRASRSFLSTLIWRPLSALPLSLEEWNKDKLKSSLHCFSPSWRCAEDTITTHQQ